LQKS
jgi:hypothetical protein